jgi:rhamnogalacturonyl hydrolase YesR
LITTLLNFNSLVFKDAIASKPKKGSPQEHLAAAQNWLKHAHDKSPDGGVSYGYSLRGGWLPSYRETSGYIATTFFQLADELSDQNYFDRAIEICRWLISVQNEDGSFANPKYGTDGIVFDTGQDLFGLVRAYEKTGDTSFKDAAKRAADWLVRVADNQGRWTRFEHMNTPHTYNTRSAWAVLRMNQIEHDPERERVARANLDWAVAEQQATGFFDNCSFEKGVAPYTHTIAYTTRGLLESGLLLNEQRYLDAAKRCADAAIKYVGDDGFLPGQISVDGKTITKYCCLTGNCQFSIIWAKLFDRTNEEIYRTNVIKATDYVMGCQDINTTNLDIHGAIKGSQPIWGRYAPFSFPNWATKFFVDAMMLRNRWL